MKRVRFEFGDARTLDPAIRKIIGECGYWPGCERDLQGNHAANCPGKKWGNRSIFAIIDGTWRLGSFGQ